MAEKWHPNDRRKIQRSLQIYFQTGSKASDIYSEQQQQRHQQAKTPSSAREDNVNGDADPAADGDIAQGGNKELTRFPTLLLWTHTPKIVLEHRLNARIDTMLSRGLLAEARTLDQYRSDAASKGGPVDMTRGIWASIGYKEYLPYLQRLEAGESKNGKEMEKLLEECVEVMKGGTRRYAKRQIRWIRIKLLRALRGAGSAGRVFVVDTGEPSRWDEAVLDPASHYVRRFLEDKTLPDPKQESQMAAELLTPTQEDLKNDDSRDAWKTNTCETCGVVAVTERDWEKHIKGNAHKKAVGARRKREARESESKSMVRAESRGM